jgi:ADP-heptose:LPS heptosyltransferase
LIRTLLIRPGAIGDFVVSLPALEHLKSAYTEAWVSEQNVPLARFADHARSIGSTSLNLLGLEGVEPPTVLLEKLRSFDRIVSWYGARREEFRRAVQGLPFEFLAPLPEGSAMHATDFYLEQVGAPDEAVPRIDCPRWDGGFAVIHPFSGSATKNWPLENFRALAARLESRMPVKWCAGPSELLDGAVRIDNLYELACWLAGARLFVGNDSGIAHLAAAVGTPVLTFFGPTDPSVWAPRGPQVQVVRVDMVR